MLDQPIRNNVEGKLKTAEIIEQVKQFTIKESESFFAFSEVFVRVAH